MASNTLDMLSGFLTPDLLRQAARATGESEGGVAKALGAAFPALLGQMAHASSNTSAMGSIADLLKSPAAASVLGQGGGIFSQVGSLLGSSGASSPLGTIASTLIGLLFGKNAGGLLGTLGSLAGLRNAGSAGSLLSLAAPIVLGALRHRLGDAAGGLTGAALGALLGREKDSILGAVPGPLGGMLGLLGGGAGPAGQSAAAAVAAPVATAASVAATAAAATRTPAAPTTRAAAVPVQEAQSSGSSGLIFGILLALGILGGLVFLLSQYTGREAPKVTAPAPTAAPGPAKPATPPAAAPKVAAPAPAPAPAPAQPAATPPPAPAKPASLLAALKPAAGGLMALALPTGKTIEIAKEGVESKLIGFLEDATRPIDKGTWFDFDRLSFKTAASDLTPESRAQVEAVAEIMKAFPASQIKIGGYTDNQGDPQMNLKLSDERARRVMSELVSLGIAADRLAAEGYGEQHPLAGNDTAEGRAKNRRTALSVRQR